VLAKHKKNIEKITEKAQINEYVRQHFDRQRQLMNCKGERDWCGRLNECSQHSTKVQSQAKLVDNDYSYVQCLMMLILYSTCNTSKKYVFQSLDDPILQRYWADI
jgi:hypothetical protein